MRGLTNPATSGDWENIIFQYLPGAHKTIFDFFGFSLAIIW
jgi:hypothetical protein